MTATVVEDYVRTALLGTTPLRADGTALVDPPGAIAANGRIAAYWSAGDEDARTADAQFRAVVAGIDAQTDAANAVAFRPSPAPQALAADEQLRIDRLVDADNEALQDRAALFPYYFEGEQRADTCTPWTAINNALGLPYSVLQERDAPCPRTLLEMVDAMRTMMLVENDAVVFAGARARPVLRLLTRTGRLSPAVVRQVFGSTRFIVQLPSSDAPPRFIAVRRLVLLSEGGNGNDEARFHRNVWVYMDPQLATPLLVNVRGLARLLVAASGNRLGDRSSGAIGARFLAFGLEKADSVVQDNTGTLRPEGELLDDDRVAFYFNDALRVALTDELQQVVPASEPLDYARVRARWAATGAVSLSEADVAALQADAYPVVDNVASPPPSPPQIAAEPVVDALADDLEALDIAASPVLAEQPTGDARPLELPTRTVTLERIGRLRVHGLTEVDEAATCARSRATDRWRRDIGRRLKQLGGAGGARRDGVASVADLMVSSRDGDYRRTRYEQRVMLETGFDRVHTDYWRRRLREWTRAALARLHSRQLLEAARNETWTAVLALDAEFRQLRDRGVPQLDMDAARASVDAAFEHGDGDSNGGVADALDAALRIDRLAGRVVLTREELQDAAARLTSGDDAGNMARALATLGVPRSDEWLATLPDAQRRAVSLVMLAPRDSRPAEAVVRAAWERVVDSARTADGRALYAAAVVAPRVERALADAVGARDNLSNAEVARIAARVLEQIDTSSPTQAPLLVDRGAWSAFAAAWLEPAPTDMVGSLRDESGVDLVMRAEIEQLNAQALLASAPVMRSATYTEAQAADAGLSAWVDEDDPWLGDTAASSYTRFDYERYYVFEWMSARGPVFTTRSARLRSGRARGPVLGLEPFRTGVDGRYWVRVALVRVDATTGVELIVARGASATASVLAQRLCVRCGERYRPSLNGDDACTWFEHGPVRRVLPVDCAQAGALVGRHSSRTRAPDLARLRTVSGSERLVLERGSVRRLWGVDFARIATQIDELLRRGHTGEAAVAVDIYNSVLTSSTPRQYIALDERSYCEVGLEGFGISAVLPYVA